MDLTLWTVRASAVCYVAALAGLGARAMWTAGCALFLAHVAAAFHFHHRWSHAAAVAETARQTEALFGVSSGFGLWFNYVFAAVWLADVVWWWGAPERYASRPRWMSAAVHGFMAFMFFNGAVVFASGPTRWLGLAATVWLAVRRLSRSRCE
ncbi:MAG: hypothetical protein IT162_23405 [Bryobacterales bacterium]|nr:hypothetical protein [Bryobacterales bacterium]